MLMLNIFLSLVPWLATTVTFKNAATCPRFIGHYGGHAKVNGTGVNRNGTWVGAAKRGGNIIMFVVRLWVE